jgi:hypothetical protein
MNQAPNLWHLSSLLLHCEHNQAGIKKGDQIMWVPARAIGRYPNPRYMRRFIQSYIKEHA